MDSEKLHRDPRTPTLVAAWRALLAGLTPIAVVMLGLNVLLATVFGPAPAWLVQAELVSPALIHDVAARVAVARAQTDLDARRPLTVMLGLSTAREGVDPALFVEASGGHGRLLNLACSGGSFSEMNAYAQPLFDSGLHPDAIILGLHPSWLAGRGLRTPRPWPGRPDSAEPDAIARYGRELMAFAVDHLWVLANRQALHAKIHMEMEQLRVELGRALGAPMELAGERSVDPWISKPMYDDLSAPAAFRQLQLEQWTSLGWFDPARLGDVSHEAKQLRALLTSARAATPKVIVVLMPEDTAFRYQVPDKAVTSIRRIVANVDPSIPVLDARASMEAEAFRDQAHLNAIGRHQFSTLLAQRLRVKGDKAGLLPATR